MSENEMNTLKLEVIKWICTLEDEVILQQLEDILKEEKK